MLTRSICDDRFQRCSARRTPGTSFTIGFAAVTVMSTALLTVTTAYAEDSVESTRREYGASIRGRQSVTFDPRHDAGQIIVSFADRRLYHVTARGRAVSYPIAIPRIQSRWQGKSIVSMKRENPSWTPTPDMVRENPRLPSWVPGGHPMNPMGIRALYLGETMYRIHGTDAPWTIGTAASKGCIRMLNEDVLHLYPLIPVGTPVTVTWEKFQTGVPVAAADHGRKALRGTAKMSSNAEDSF